MYYANCEWYVDMGEHNKPLCERKNLRSAKCSECPVYIRIIEDENAKLRELENIRMSQARHCEDLDKENANLREQMDWLLTLLRNDCDIDASWDGLRKFWSIGLTEDGCLIRDRACKAEAENAKLRELVRDMWHEGAFEAGACYVEEAERLEERTRELGIETNYD